MKDMLTFQKVIADRIVREKDVARAVIRREIATAAMVGLLADHKDHSDECADGETCSRTVARLAVQHADDLMSALEK